MRTTGTGWTGGLRAFAQFSAAVGATAAFSGVAFAGDIDGALLGETRTLTGAPLMAAVAPAKDYVDDAEPLEAPDLMASGPRLQCVPFAREASGLQLWGNASTWWRQAAGKFEREAAPSEGSVMVMRGYRNTRRGHVAVVRQVLSSRSIIIDHANWLNSGEITVNVPVVDVSPKNDWTQVRVWHIPTHSWGVRVYTVQGFILPPAPEGGGGAPIMTLR